MASWRNPAIGACVLALHAVALLVLIRWQFASPPPSAPEREITLLLPSLTPPKPAKADANRPGPATQAPPSHTFTITLPPDLAAPPATAQDTHALEGLGAALNCGAANYDRLDAVARAACGRGPWAYDRDKKETAALILKAPHVMTHAERAERIRSTVDPCAAEKLTRQNDCIFRVIWGDKLP
ncbi:MAG: hypothetical protein ACREHE_09235 [Rhizomicrobium sp.]